ncbi:hypothetical protein ACTM89_14180, partial [Citrobacter freundii]
ESLNNISTRQLKPSTTRLKTTHIRDLARTCANIPFRRFSQLNLFYNPPTSGDTSPFLLFS